MGTDGDAAAAGTAGEIERLRAECARLRAQLEARPMPADAHRVWFEHASEGAWRFELDEPLDPSLPHEAQVDHVLRHAWLAECNDAMARMYGFERASDITGARLSSMLDPSAPANREFLGAFLRSGYHVHDAETRELDREGRQRWFANNLVGVVEEDGRLVRAWGTQREITDRKALEEDLRQAMKMEAIGRLAAGLAHDFNNLLTAVIGHAEMAEDRLPRHHEALADIDAIRISAERAASLTRQLLAIARRQVVQPALLDLNEVVVSLEAVLRRVLPREVSLVIDLEREPWHVLADRGQIEQVILNLAVNGRDAMPAGGTLTIETRNEVVDGRDHVVVVVTDSGTGIEDEVRRHLFEPYYTTKEIGRGTGLGLATCHGIVTQTGGRIEVATEPGKGSTFRVHLPRATGGQGAPVPAAPPELLPDHVPRGTETVLLVDDEPAVRLLAAQVLRHLGYDVIESAGPDEALAVLQRDTQPIDLLLTDMIMPRMNGREIADRARKARPGLRVLFTSGYPGDAVLAGEDAAAAFLAKPFTRAELARAVRDALERD